MKIIITAGEANDKGIWEWVCDKKGFDIYAMANGMGSETEIELSEAEALEVGLIEKGRTSDVYF